MSSVRLAAADDLDFSAASRKLRLKTESCGYFRRAFRRRPNVDRYFAEKEFAIAGDSASPDQERDSYRSVGVVAGTQWACTWTEPTPKAADTALFASLRNRPVKSPFGLYAGMSAKGSSSWKELAVNTSRLLFTRKQS